MRLSSGGGRGRCCKFSSIRVGDRGTQRTRPGAAGRWWQLEQVFQHTCWRSGDAADETRSSRTVVAAGAGFPAYVLEIGGRSGRDQEQQDGGGSWSRFSSIRVGDRGTQRTRPGAAGRWWQLEQVFQHTCWRSGDAADETRSSRTVAAAGAGFPAYVLEIGGRSGRDQEQQDGGGSWSRFSSIRVGDRGTQRTRPGAAGRWWQLEQVFQHTCWRSGDAADETRSSRTVVAAGAGFPAYVLEIGGRSGRDQEQQDGGGSWSRFSSIRVGDRGTQQTRPGAAGRWRQLEQARIYLTGAYRYRCPGTLDLAFHEPTNHNQTAPQVCWLSSCHFCLTSFACHSLVLTGSHFGVPQEYGQLLCSNLGSRLGVPLNF
ncbi:uncharacterized protein [Hyperolius riggenbachi]|uniref:uncharacterized protein isoform X4 n=1 Tax=Hyperolius riggenbachi TaxID=752182 RepID=UPI0035A2F89D